MTYDGGLESVEGTATPAPRASLDRLFSALADRQRRAAVAYLATVQNAVSRESLVRYVSTVDTTTAPASPGGRDAVTATFHHTHLPKLESVDLVEYDADRGTVAPTSLLVDVAECLSAFEANGSQSR